jgi:hypothetical protein
MHSCARWLRIIPKRIGNSSVCGPGSSRGSGHSVGRQREYAVRLALGADRERLLLLQLTEAILLAAGGTALGVALAVWLNQFVAALLLPAVAARSG